MFSIDDDDDDDIANKFDLWQSMNSIKWTSLITSKCHASTVDNRMKFMNKTIEKEIIWLPIGPGGPGGPLSPGSPWFQNNNKKELSISERLYHTHTHQMQFS